MSEFRIRPAKQSDERKIKNLIWRVGINPFCLKWQHFLLAETEQGQFIGCAQLKPHSDGSIELASVAVEKAYRGRGLARRLIEQLLSNGPRPLYLVCRPELSTFYEKFGFWNIGGENLSPYFRHIRFLFRLAKLLTGREQAIIMQLQVSMRES